MKGSKAKEPPPGQLPLFPPGPGHVWSTGPGHDQQIADYRDAVGPAPPSQRHSQTSREAAKLMEGRAGILRATIYRFLRERGSEGATDEEGQLALQMEGNTYRPRRIELWAAGLVEDTKRVRLTRSRRKAAVWQAVEGV